MTFRTICDGCGKTIGSPVNAIGNPYNPPGWYCRTMTTDSKPRILHACSGDCIDLIKAKSPEETTE